MGKSLENPSKSLEIAWKSLENPPRIGRQWLPKVFDSSPSGAGHGGPRLAGHAGGAAVGRAKSAALGDGARPEALGAPIGGAAVGAAEERDAAAWRMRKKERYHLIMI